MSYLSRQNEDAHLERQMRAEVDKLRNEVEKRFRQVEFAMVPQPQLSASPNYLLNSAVAWSHAAYTTAGVYYGTSGDDNKRAYNWGLKASNDFTGLPMEPLVSDGHSTFAALDLQKPVWDQVFGHILMGYPPDDDPGFVTYDLVAPLPHDFVAAGQRYYFSFETKLDLIEDDLNNQQVFCGFYDALNETWITGSDFVPTVNVYGQGGSRTLEYRIVATNDENNQLFSSDISVDGVVVSQLVDAPDRMTVDNHVRLYFSGTAGFNRYEIYRYDGTTYRKVADLRNSIDLQFFDIDEEAGSVEPGFPTVTQNAPRAYSVTTSLVATTDKYTVHTMVIHVPSTYDRSQTSTSLSPSGNQFFRFGLTGPIGRYRALRIRRLMLSEGYGPWTAAPQDFLALSGPVIIGDLPDLPPPIGTPTNPTGGATCVTLDTIVLALHNNLPTEMAIGELSVGDEIICGWQVLPIKEIVDGIAQSVFEITTKTGKTVKATEAHRFLRGYGDTAGTPVRVLREGDAILIDSPQGPLLDQIETKNEIIGAVPVRTLKLPSPHLFVTNGIISHNDKTEPNPWAGGDLISIEQ